MTLGKSRSCHSTPYIRLVCSVLGMDFNKYWTVLGGRVLTEKSTRPNRKLCRFSVFCRFWFSKPRLEKCFVGPVRKRECHWPAGMANLNNRVPLQLSNALLAGLVTHLRAPNSLRLTEHRRQHVGFH